MTEGLKELKESEVECKDCHLVFVPSFSMDYYGSTNSRDGQCEQCMMRKAFKKPDPVELPSDEHVRDVCLFMQGEKICRYLVMLAGSSTRPEHCAKGSDLHQAIDFNSKTMAAKGDNCSGPPDFESEE